MGAGTKGGLGGGWALAWRWTSGSRKGGDKAT